MSDLGVVVIVVTAVCLFTAVIISITKYTKKRHKFGVIVIPATDEIENVEFYVKSAFFEESFDNTPYGREILIVDYGCSPHLWEYYQKLARQYPSVRAINSYELAAYIKVKYIQKFR